MVQVPSYKRHALNLRHSWIAHPLYPSCTTLRFVLCPCQAPITFGFREAVLRLWRWAKLHKGPPQIREPLPVPLAFHQGCVRFLTTHQLYTTSPKVARFTRSLARPSNLSSSNSTHAQQCCKLEIKIAAQLLLSAEEDGKEAVGIQVLSRI